MDTVLNFNSLQPIIKLNVWHFFSQQPPRIYKFYGKLAVSTAFFLDTSLRVHIPTDINCFHAAFCFFVIDNYLLIASVTNSDIYIKINFKDIAVLMPYPY